MVEAVHQADVAVPGAGETVLEAIGLSKRYRRGGPWALHDVDLTVPRGTVTALVGPNGAGKSTLIRSWMGYERPTGGSVRVGGIDPRVDSVGALRQLGYVSQSTALYRGLTVADHLVLAAHMLYPHREPRTRNQHHALGRRVSSQSRRFLCPFGLDDRACCIPQIRRGPFPLRLLLLPLEERSQLRRVVSVNNKDAAKRV